MRKDGLELLRIPWNIITQRLLYELMQLPWHILLVVSTVWIVYRIFLVFQKPTEELEEVLGIDIPPVPDVQLGKITSDTVLLYWKPPENYHSPLKHWIQINGINVGECKREDSRIQVGGLHPGNYYGIRVIATNASGNSSYSSLIQIQTIPEHGHRGTKLFTSAEHGNSKRHSSIRRISQPLQSDHNSLSTNARTEKDNTEAIILQLTNQLDSLKQQNEDAEIQLKQESDDTRTTREELLEQRDELKNKVDDSDKALAESKKQAVDSEKAWKNAQRKKSDEERKLRKKKEERRKITDNILKWQSETDSMYENASDLRAQKISLEETHEKEMAAVRDLIAEADLQHSQMESQLHKLGKEVNKLVDERARADREQNEEEEEAERRENEEQQSHEIRIQELQTEYATYWKMNTAWEASCQEMSSRVTELLDIRTQNPTAFAPVLGLDTTSVMYPAPSSTSAARRTRPNVPRMANFPLSHAPGSASHATVNSTSSASPTISSAFPSWAFGFTSSPAASEHANLNTSDMDNLNVGALMSPSADAFLPSDLLDDQVASRPTTDFHRTSSAKRASNPLSDSFRPSSTDFKSQDPQSPLSTNSKSPSLLSSPHENFNQIGSFYAQDQLDVEGGSVPTSLSPFAGPIMAPPKSNPFGSAHKISNLLGLHRQRNSGSSELPALGTLKQGHTKSFPLDLDQNLNPTTGGRRKTNGIWSNPMSGLLTRGAGAASGERRGIFGSRLEPSENLNRPTSRPTSVYSFGEGGWPSDGQQLGWQTPDSGGRPRGGTTGSEWNANGNGPWSGRSRRQSLQHGSTSNLSIGSTPLDHDDYLPPHSSGRTSQPTSMPAPIGTERHRISQRSNTPKLNPTAAPFTAPLTTTASAPLAATAPSFKSRLWKTHDSKKTPRSEKSHDFGSEKSRGKDTDRSSDIDLMSKNSSPLMSRHSQDERSILTSESYDDYSHDGLERSYSANPSEPAEPSSASTQKESLVRRITRKGSSSKFGQLSMPWGKDRASRTSLKDKPSTPGEVDEDGGDYMSKSHDSSSSTPIHEKSVRGSISWSRVSSVISKGKRKSEVAPSESSERASEIASETDGGEDDA